jgi:hypothetical protein
MNNINGQNKNLFENLNATEDEVYNALIELGWILPRNEEDFRRAEKALEGTECPPLSPKLKDPTSLIERLRKEEQDKNQTKLFKGILVSAKALGINNFQLAEKIGLSVVLVTKLDLGLIIKRIPTNIVESLASILNVNSQQLYDYWDLGPRFAARAEYKATDAPKITEEQDFFEAVRQDTSLSDLRRAELLDLEKDL